MLQRLILGSIIVSAMIMKSDQARKCELNSYPENSITQEINVKHTVFSRVSGNAYKFVFHALNDAEIRSTTNSNNYIE